MCYDISFTVNIESIYDYFPELIKDDEIEIDFDSAIHILGHAYGTHPIIYINREDFKPHLKLMEWGCIPFHVKEEKSFLKQRATMHEAKEYRKTPKATGIKYVTAVA